MVTGSGESVWVTETSAARSTVVLSVALLLAERTSGLLPAIVAVFFSVPAAVGRTTMAKVACPLSARVRVAKGRMFAFLLVGAGVAETKVTPAGSVSVTVTPVAGVGLLLAAVRV